MIGPLLSARINEIYAGYLDRDRFESSFPDESRDGRPTSMRNFLQAMSLPPVEHDSGIITPMLGDLDMLVSEFLETPFSVIRGDRLPMGVAVFTIFCASAVEIVKRDAFTFSVLCDDELKVALLQENDCSTMQQLSQLVSSANVSKELAQRFFLQLQSAWGPRTLRSFSLNIISQVASHLIGLAPRPG